MITDAIISLFVLLYGAIISLLPTGSYFPQEITDAVNEASSIIHMFDAIFPVTTTMYAILFLVGLNIAIFVYYSVMLFINTVRGN